MLWELPSLGDELIFFVKASVPVHTAQVAVETGPHQTCHHASLS